jgi:hypothetical protein
MMASCWCATGCVVVAALGAIGQPKGLGVLAACAEDANIRRLPLRFALLGHSIDDARLLATGRCFVTGRYMNTEINDLIRREWPVFAFLPSVWPETWCFTLTELWQAGLHVMAFAIGAPAERLRRTNGTLLPLGLSPAEINDRLLKAARVRSRIALLAGNPVLTDEPVVGE